MGASGAGSGASGSDAGFQNSVETRNKKANKKNLGTSDYQGDLDSRNSDKRNYNNNNVGGNGGNGANVRNNANVTVPLITPTASEVSQSNAANAVNQEDPLYLRKKKTKAIGRSATILTSSKGVDEGLTLGKKSLLGS